MTIAGSNSLHPFAEMLAEDYMARNPDVRIAVQGIGSTAGIQAVREGSAAIGMVSRNLHDDEKDLKAVVVARDAIAIVVHPSNPVNDLTTEQVRDIFAGRTTDFGQVGGNKAPIGPITREEGSGTRGAFEELVMKEERVSDRAMVNNSNGSIREVIGKDPAAIGFISLGTVNNTVKALRIDGAEATRENVKNGTYRFGRPFQFVLKAEPEGLVKEFIDFALSEEGQRLLEQEGLIRVK